MLLSLWAQLTQNFNNFQIQLLLGQPLLTTSKTASDQMMLMTSLFQSSFLKFYCTQKSLCCSITLNNACAFKVKPILKRGLHLSTVVTLCVNKLESVLTHIKRSTDIQVSCLRRYYLKICETGTSAQTVLYWSWRELPVRERPLPRESVI